MKHVPMMLISFNRFAYGLRLWTALTMIGMLSLSITNGAHAQNVPPLIPSEVSDNPDLTLNPDELEEFEVKKAERLEELRTNTREKAINNATRTYLPLEQDEIENFLGRLRSTQESIQKPVHVPPTPDIHVEEMALDPSALPPTVKLASDNVTSLTILDITGQPWPIVDIGFGGAFDVKPPEAGGHVIRITPLKEFAHGNMSVRLLDFSTPLTFGLKAGTDTVHYRFDARIPEYGPNANLPVIERGLDITAGDTVVTGVLEGVKPADATELIVEGTDGRTSAYRMGKTLYIRTPHTMLSPTWRSSASSADGMTVYVIDDTPVILLSSEGTMMRVRITQE